MAFIDANRHRWPVVAMWQVFGLSERTFDAAKKRTPCTRAMSDQVLRVEVRRVWESNYRVYGAKRARLTLRREGLNVVRCSVERLISEVSMAGVQRSRRPQTTIRDSATFVQQI